MRKDFDLQETLAQHQFEKDKASLGDPPDPIALKGFYTEEINKLIEKSKSESVSLYELRYFEICIKNGIVDEYLRKSDKKLVYDRFYAKYPILKQDGYDQINFANFTRNRSTDLNKFKGEDMNLIGKKVVLQIGGEKPPEDDPNDKVIGSKTVLHVPTSELGKYNKIVGEEHILIIGEDEIKKKNKNDSTTDNK